MNFQSTKGQKNAIPSQNDCSEDVYDFIYETLEARYFPLGPLERSMATELDCIICCLKFKHWSLSQTLLSDPRYINHIWTATQGHLNVVVLIWKLNLTLNGRC